jgi:hypothetical protein
LDPGFPIILPSSTSTLLLAHFRRGSTSIDHRRYLCSSHQFISYQYISTMRLMLATRALTAARRAPPQRLASLARLSICNEQFTSTLRFSSTSSMHEPTLFNVASSSTDNDDQSDGKQLMNL